MQPNNISRLLLFLPMAFTLLLCVPHTAQAQQMAISWSVVGISGAMGGTDGANRFVSTAGQSAIGFGTAGTIAISQGFWTPRATPASVNGSTIIAGAFQLRNYPNPFSTSTTIAYRLDQPYRVRLRITDLLGAPTATLVDKIEEAGDHSVEWTGNTSANEPAAGGMYLYELSLQPSGGNAQNIHTEQRKLMLVR